MWPLKRIGRRSTQECLLVGRQAAERWSSVNGGLTLQDSVELSTAVPWAQSLASSILKDAVRALYPTSPSVPVQVILESAWLPVALLEVGSGLLNAAQLQTLARYRFTQLLSDSADPGAPNEPLELRIECRAGSRQALAYALAPELKRNFEAAAKASNLQWAALSPALSWGWARLCQSKMWPRSAAWFIWPEQDRTLLARVSGEAVVGLNPGASVVGSATEISRLLDAEGARLGLEARTEVVAAATWRERGFDDDASGIDTLRWLDIRNPDNHVQRLHHQTRQTVRLQAQSEARR